MENLTGYCAPGTKIKDEMVKLSETVSLRLMTFEPEKDHGNPAVVFIAGWISHIKSWQLSLKEMTKDFTVYYVETREKVSAKIKGKEGYGVEDIGRDLVTIINRLNLADSGYILFGSSLGGTAILDCAHSFDNPPLCLVLVGPNAVFRVPKVWKGVIRILPPCLYNILKPVVKWYLKTFRLDIKSDYAQYEKYCNTLDAADPFKLRKAVMSVWNYQVWDLLGNIKIPSLIISASKDKLHEPGNLEKMVSLMPAATYLDLETNARTHSEDMVHAMRKYIADL